MPSLPGEPDRPCLWMSAGLLSYHLCDHDFDCEHCPLDAALRGEAPAASEAEGMPAATPVVFPAGRRYTRGHLWVQRDPGGETVRFGLDAIAAALLGRPRAVHVSPQPEVGAGAPLCELETAAGVATFAAPMACRAPRLNPALDTTPALAALAPYGDGWLLEAQSSPGETPDLLDEPAARQVASHDLRHLRRRIALELLSEPEVGPTLADGGTPLTDLRRILGPQRYLALVRELVH